jgi:hypothetical protein
MFLRRAACQSVDCSLTVQIQPLHVGLVKVVIIIFHGKDFLMIQLKNCSLGVKQQSLTHSLKSNQVLSL